ncbi:MAG: hypothetical protein ACRDNX_13485, partial [Gaiellaceae bacterium]
MARVPVREAPAHFGLAEVEAAQHASLLETPNELFAHAQASGDSSWIGLERIHPSRPYDACAARRLRHRSRSRMPRRAGGLCTTVADRSKIVAERSNIVSVRSTVVSDRLFSHPRWGRRACRLSSA